MESNKTTDCLNPAYAFSSSQSLSRCFQVFEDERSSTSSDNYGYNSSYVDRYSTFGRLIGECIDQYCDKPNPALGGCGPGTMNNWGVGSHFIAANCESVNTVSNEDFSGPGVFLTDLSSRLGITYC